MKILVILCFASFVVAEPFIRKCGNGSSDLNAINLWRQIVSQKANVTNMYELKYNVNLENEIRKMKSCDDVAHGLNFRVNGTDAKTARAAVYKVIRKWEHRYVTEWMDNAEFFHPTQTFYALCYLNEVCKFEYTDQNNRRYTYRASVVEVFGQKSTFHESDFLYGKPSSNCENGVVTTNCTTINTCGLCKGPEVPPRIPFTDISDSVAPSVNAIFILPVLLMVNIVNVY
ncbi:unnamed protein product [Caenorhabditis brenneri]